MPQNDVAEFMDDGESSSAFIFTRFYVYVFPNTNQQSLWNTARFDI